MNKKKITAFAMATLAACSMSSIMALADDQVTITMVESLTIRMLPSRSYLRHWKMLTPRSHRC